MAFGWIFSTAIFATQPLTSNDINQTLSDVYYHYKNNHEGKTAEYIPELAKVNPNLFGIVVMTVNGKVYSIGNANIPFAIESIAKPFLYALALQDNGENLVTKRVGLNATGHAFNSIESLTESPDHLQNPLVNAGAILVTSLIKGQDSNDKWERTLNFFKKLSNDEIFLGTSVYESEMATNQRNQAIAQLLSAYGMLMGNPEDAIARYTKACSIMITAQQLAIMGATLANKGINPITHEQVITPDNVRDVLAEMTINGLYENSGAWWFKIGLPAKSGVGGGILAVVPGKMAIVVYSPRVDAVGNSVRAQKVISELANRWHLHLLGK